MTWADGSVFKGSWENGVQNGIGIMIFANGSKKAGFFKENVLTELLTDVKMIQNFESKVFFPTEFKQELLDYIKEKNPKEDSKKYLHKELKTN